MDRPNPRQAEQAEHQFRQYFYHLHNADAELARMAEFISAREWPTVILLFGDHLPALSAAYKELGFKNGRVPRAEKGISHDDIDNAADQYDLFIIVAHDSAVCPRSGLSPFFAHLGLREW